MVMTDSSREYFKAHAGDWDSLRKGYFRESVRQVAVEHAFLRPEFKVADIGSGTGFLAAALAPLVSRVYAVDGSAEMINVARKTLAGFNSVTYLVSDGLKMDLPDESLDAVFANMYLHHCPDPLAAIREMARLLRPGGRLVLTDADAHSYEWFREEMADVWLGFERGQIRDWFRQAGLVNVLVENTGETCCANAEKVEVKDEKHRQASVSIFVAVGAKSVQGMKAEVAREYRKHAVEGTKCGCSCEPAPEGQSCCAGESRQTSGAQQDKFLKDPEVSYAEEVLSGAPAEAVEMSLGCGNPLAMSRLQVGETVVDIGSGAGLDAFLAAKKVGPRGKVIGIDMTTEMIARARATAEKEGFTQVEFRLGQAELLPVADSSVDVVMSNCVINLTEDKGRVFAEAFRALKPGGRLELSDMVAGGAFAYRPGGGPGTWASCVDGALPEAEYLGLIKDAGFNLAGTKRSKEAEVKDGVKVYSLIVSAEKPAGSKPGGCCCG